VARNLGAIEVVADERGAFEQKFGFPLHLFEVSYAFTVTAIDENGEQAIPSAFTVVVGKKKEQEASKKPPQ